MKMPEKCPVCGNRLWKTTPRKAICTRCAYSVPRHIHRAIWRRIWAAEATHV